MRTRSVIKATKANRVAGIVPNEKQITPSNNSVKKQAKALGGGTNPQGFNPRKAYACIRKKVNFADHTSNGGTRTAVQLRRAATLVA